MNLMTSAALAAVACASACAQNWTHYGRDVDRVAVRALALDRGRPIGPPLWTANTGPAGEQISFAGQSGVLRQGDHIVAFGRVDGAFSVIDLRQADGSVRWFQPVEAPYAESWSSPAIDSVNNTVIVASGQSVRAFALADGSFRWQTPLQEHVVNASPLVTTSLGASDRVFITDYGYGGHTSRLYCINIDAFNGGSNPFSPGQVVWSVPVPQLTGASPTLAGSNVVLATGQGRIVAYPAAAAAPPEPAWDTPNPGGLGLFGGVSARGGYVFAASYGFYGGQTSSNLVKIDASTGQVIWTVPSNRTDSLPIPLADGRILLSTGPNGFGSHASLQLFQDHGSSATMLWDTFLAGGPDVGFWTHTPVVLESSQGTYALAGTPPIGDPFGPLSSTLVVDLSKLPAQPGFVVQTLSGSALTAIGMGGKAVGVGSAGLRSYQIPIAQCAADFNQNGGVDFFDIIAYLQAYSAGDLSADVNGDGAVNFFDLQGFLVLYSQGCS